MRKGTQRAETSARRRSRLGGSRHTVAGAAIATAVAVSLVGASVVQASAPGHAPQGAMLQAAPTDGSVVPTTTMQPPDASIPPRPDVPKTILSPAFQGMSGADGRIARLYAAFYLRDPDASGFQYWQDRIAAGDWTNDDTAQFFSSSTEFISLYGESLTNRQYVQLLYQNTLSRLPDEAGFDFWLNLLENEGWTRGQVALRFSDAPEFRALTMTS